MIHERVMQSDGGTASEIEYTNGAGEVVGYWAYVYFDTRLPYQGVDGALSADTACRVSGGHKLRWEKSDWDGLKKEDVGTCEKCGLQGFGYSCDDCGAMRIAVGCECEEEKSIKEIHF